MTGRWWRPPADNPADVALFLDHGETPGARDQASRLEGRLPAAGAL
jgi:hypothetical protein